MIMMRKTLVLVALAAFLMISIVSADELQGFIESPTTISTVCIRNSQIMTNVTVIVRVYDYVGNLVYGPVNSTPGGNGTFSTAYTFNTVGKYATKETCDFGDYLADGSTAINIIRPVFGNMQVLAQAIKETIINRTVKAEWLITSFNSTNTSINSGICGVADIDGNIVTPIVNTTVTNDILFTSFRADPGYGFIEGTNYEILCNISLSGGLMVNGIKNYVYITPDLTYLQYLGQLISQVGQILGIVQETQVTANQTLSISNQTLQIVSALNMTGGGNSTVIIDIKNDTSQILDILDVRMETIS